MRFYASMKSRAGYAWHGGLLLLAAAGLSAAPLAHAVQGSDNTEDGSMEPIISQPTETTPDAGIGGTVQAPLPPPAPMASLNGAAATRYIIFAVRKQDWKADRPAVPSARPTGVVGKFTDVWQYDGSSSNKHSYHFNIDGRQEGTTFLLVVQTNRPGSAPTYTTKPVTVRRAAK